jgi:hypothetical protein
MRDAIVRAALLAVAAGLYPPLPAFSRESDSLSISGAPALACRLVRLMRSLRTRLRSAQFLRTSRSKTCRSGLRLAGPGR